MRPNSLYFGDNLEILTSKDDNGNYVFLSDSIDLIYLDPPFISKQSFNLLYKTPEGKGTQAQITAFKDTWGWGVQSEREYREMVSVFESGKAPQPMLPYMTDTLTTTIRALREMLGMSDMMARRLLELHRVLKPTGSLYLHCDPTASHYLKIILDSIFGRQGHFNNEIIWRRTTTKNDYQQGAVNFPRVHDVILMYYKDPKVKRIFQQPFTEHSDELVKKSYRHKDQQGRPYTLGDLTAPGRGLRGHPKYEFMGITRYWRYSEEKMEELLAEGRIIQARPGAVPRYIRYLDEMLGVAVSDVWDDISPVQGQSKEYLGYPTQKPLALLERIITASTKEGDIVLDPFCGCGTAVHAAQRLARQWMGIDINYPAIDLIERRLRNAYTELQFDIMGKPRDVEGARALALRGEYQFQWWVCSQLNMQPHQGKKKGADQGVDGIGYFADVENGKPVTRKVILSVQGGKEKNITPDMVRSLVTVTSQQGAEIGLFVSFKEPTREMERIVGAAGEYQAGNGRTYPRLQMLTIEDLLVNKKRPLYPDMSLGQETFKSAPKEKPDNGQRKLL